MIPSKDRPAEPGLGLPTSSAFELLSAFLQLSPDAAIVVDTAGTIQAANELAAQLFAYRPEDMHGASVEMLIPERHRMAHIRHREMFAAHPRTRAMGTNLDLQGRRKDGSEFPVQISLAPLAEEATPGMTVAAIRDLTSWRRTEADLAQAHAAYEVFAERDRIARELNEKIISRLFAAGLALQGVASMITQADLAVRIQNAITELDATMREIRSTVFGNPRQNPQW